MKLSILVIENDELTRLSIVYMLDSLNYRVAHVKDQDAALSILQSVLFDVVILSLPREDPDGELFAAETKLLQPLIKVIVVSGGVRQKTNLSLLIDKFVKKPFSLLQIDEAIKRVTVPFKDAQKG